MMFLLSRLLDPSPQPTGSELARDLDRLRETARVLYIAAHPDDENTQFLAYMANARGWRTAYLSLTRGEGGQNAIGDELGHGLGVIRTYELLTARRNDGAEQWITRQRDFGYSKSGEEALEVWGATEALSDVVWTIRRFRPDVVVARFPEEGTTHGHHLASARLARSAFAAAGDPTAFPEQLVGESAVTVWQPARLLYNVPLRWMGGEIEPHWYTIDLGGYDALLGRSFGELSAESRSRHRSQAFGAAARRGPDVEAFELLAGSEPEGPDPFADIPSGWATRPGGARLAAALEAESAAFDARHPAASIPAMLAALSETASLEPADAEAARSSIEAWIVAAAGLHLDARVETPFVAPGDTVEVTVHALAQADDGWSLTDVAIVGAATSEDFGTQQLPRHTPHAQAFSVTIPADAPVTTPYWLAEPSTPGAYTVSDRGQIGDPIGQPALVAALTVSRDGFSPFVVEVPVRAVRVEPTLGERVEPLTVLPPLVVEPARPVVLLPNGRTGDLTVVVHATTDVSAGRVALELPSGWSASPQHHEVTLGAGGRATLPFTLTAPRGAEAADVRITAQVGDRSDAWTRQTIDYPHLPPLTMLLPATVRATALELTPPEGAIGYVLGPGDAGAGMLQAAGFDIRLLDDSALRNGDLSGYRAIIVGPRAFHDRPALVTHTDRLWEFAARGGVVIVQYQTNNRLQPLTVDVGPAPISIGRGRVTLETAPIQWLDAGASLRDGPHQLGDTDFEGWVQERGLYFAESWSDGWTPLIALSDPGEDAQQGALLVVEHGSGAVFYTGLALFRQLPAGVAGAYRLLANMLAWGTDE